MRECIVSKWKLLILALALVWLSAGSGTCQTGGYETMSRTELQEKIAALDLGLDTYVLGKALTEEQLIAAEKDSAYTSYPGTLKFKDKDTFVIVDEETKVVIALYVRNREARREDFKAMVGELMLLFGEPTAEAHGKNIYWNYAATGLIPEELYRTAKKEGMLHSLGVLATVKFSSSQNVDTLTTLGKEQKSAEKGVEVTSDNYVMIQSDILSKKYLGL